MRYIPIIFFIFLFSLTFISCKSSDDEDLTSSASSSSAGSSSEIVSVSDSGGYIQIESTNHSLDEGDVIRFTTTDTLPAGLALATDYYVVGTPSTNTFFVSANESGTPIAYTDGGTGTHSWQIAFALGSTGTYQLATHDYANGVVTDSSGNVYLVGGTKGERMNGVNIGYNMTEIFVIKYNSSGARQWTKVLGTWKKDFANAVNVDSSGNIYLVGATEKDLVAECKKGKQECDNFAGKDDLFVVKFDSKGKKKWTKQLGTKRNDRATGVATDSSGNIYVTGYTYWKLDGNTHAGSNDAFVVKYLDNGTKLWTKQFGTPSSDLADGVAVDSSGNVYVVGYTYGDLDGNTNTGASDIFVVKYNSSGTKQWTKQIGSSSQNYYY